MERFFYSLFAFDRKNSLFAFICTVCPYRNVSVVVVVVAAIKDEKEEEKIRQE